MSNRIVPNKLGAMFSPLLLPDTSVSSNHLASLSSGEEHSVALGIRTREGEKTIDSWSQRNHSIRIHL